MKTTTKLKTCIILFTLGFYTQMFALEFWRPDKPTGVQIEFDDCVRPSSIHCATFYDDGSDIPIGTINGYYLPS